MIETEVYIISKRADEAVQMAAKLRRFLILVILFFNVPLKIHP